MKSHWNEDEFAGYVIAPQAQSHANECDDCRVEVDEFRRELAGFREVVRAAAERPPFFWSAQRAAIRARVRNSARRGGIRLALASGVALCVVAVALLMPATKPQQMAGATAHQVDQDELLMREVDDALLSNVAEPLEPANLIATDMGNALTKAQKDLKK